MLANVCSLPTHIRLAADLANSNVSDTAAAVVFVPASSQATPF